MHVMDSPSVLDDLFLCDLCCKELGQAQRIVKKLKGQRLCRGKSAPEGRARHSPTVHQVNSFGLKSQCSTDTSSFNMRTKHLYKTLSLLGSLNVDMVIEEEDVLRHLNIFRLHCGSIAEHIHMEGTYRHLWKPVTHFYQRLSENSGMWP